MTMRPETIQRVHDWIEVRESLLGRVESLDPTQVWNRSVRPMYAHLLVALRRATITLVRLIAAEDESEGGQLLSAEETPRFIWNGVNYLAKIW